MPRIVRSLLADRIWPVFFAFSLLAWIGLLLLAVDHGGGPPLGALSAGFDAELWRALCAVSPTTEPFGLLVLMWSLMAGAMMAPTALPVLAAYRDLTQGRPGADIGLAAFLGGFLAVWLVFAVMASGAQSALAAAALLSPHAVSVSDWLTALLLALAGVYQFSALKAACLSKCRAPLPFLMSRWRAGAAGAFRMGLSHGAVCVGCCWALMLLAFVGGTMNLAWMGGAMVLMFLEKLPEIGNPVTRPLGLVLILAALLVAARASGLA